MVKPNPNQVNTGRNCQELQNLVFPSTIGNLLLGIWGDVLGRLRKSSSSSERGALQHWALLMRSHSAWDTFKIVSRRSYAAKAFGQRTSELVHHILPERMFSDEDQQVAMKRER
jgi:hypothetical protein